MNTQLVLITLVILLLGFFSSGPFQTYTGTAISDVGSSMFHDSTSVRIWKDNSFSEASTGEELLTFTLPRKPESCILKGRWETTNNYLQNLGRKQRACHDGQGTFVGYVDRYGQYVDTDPYNFRWAGPSEASIDPISQRMEGYILYVHTCDHLYYTPKDKRNYARAWVENFGDTTLTLHTEYYDQQYEPAVDFFFDIDCTLEQEKQLKENKVALPSKPAEEKPAVLDADAFPIDIEELEPFVPEPIGKGDSSLQRLKNWLSSLFF
jgi:hypothetical protein